MVEGSPCQRWCCFWGNPEWGRGPEYSFWPGLSSFGPGLSNPFHLHCKHCDACCSTNYPFGGPCKEDGSVFKKRPAA